MTRRLTVFAIVMGLTGCGHDNSVVTPTPPPGPPQLLRVQISGNASLTTVGQTSQLTATASFTDGTSREVTTEARWMSSESSVVSVSPTGLLTVLQLGATVITAVYSNVSTSVNVRPTPPGTFVIAGWVREPGQGGVVGAKVTDTVSLTTVSSDTSGDYRLVALPRGETHLRAEKDGYETAELDATQTNGDVSMQRMIRLRDGDTAMPPRFAPNDLSYTVGGVRCFPCRLIRLVAGRAGTFHLRVTWEERAVSFSLYANGSVFPTSSTELVADVPVPGGETVAYLGMKVPTGSGPAYHVPVTIEASLR